MGDLLEDIIRKDAFKLLVGPDGSPGFSIATKDLETLDAKVYLKAVSKRGVATCIETYARIQAVMNGPKIFRPQADNLEALENMTLNVSISDYNQPFPSIIIDFPESYCRKYEMDNVIPGYREGSGMTATTRHTVDFVICHQVKEYNFLLVVVYLTSSDAYSTLLWGKEDGETLEEAIAVARNKEAYDNSLVVTTDEDNAVYHAIRAAINSILAIEEFGCLKVGPLNTVKDKALQSLTQSHLRVSRRRAVRELARQAMLYSFDQHIKLYETECVVSGEQGGSVGKKPHFRRGYYRKQHYGVGNQLVKRVRIPSVLVNGHLFGGKLSDTKATYE